MLLARKTPGCLDFVVAADPIEEGRVNVDESWSSEAELKAFLGSGANDSLNELIVRAEVVQRVIDGSSSK